MFRPTDPFFRVNPTRTRDKVEQEIITFMDKIITKSTGNDRLQNSPYFCVFKYARAVKQKVWNEVENRERDWEETLPLIFVPPLNILHFTEKQR